MEFDGWKNKLGSYTAPQRRQTEMPSFKNFNRYDNSKMGLEELAVINSVNQASGKKFLGMADKLGLPSPKKETPKESTWAFSLDPDFEDKNPGYTTNSSALWKKPEKPKLGWLGKGIGMLGGLFGRRK